MADFYTTFSGNSSYRHHARVTQGAQNIAGNSSSCSGWLWVEKTGGSGYFTSNSGNTGSMSGDVSFGGGGWAPYDFRSYSSKQIGSGSANVAHNSNGTKTASGSYAANDSAGGNFGSANGSWSLGLTTIVDVPDTPTDVTCTYVSDTQMSVAWSRPTVTNDAPNTSQISQSVNDAAYSDLAPISVTTSVTIAASANQKIRTKVRESNSAGTSAWSTESIAAYTTPAAPTSVAATKDASLNIVLTWVSNVAFTEHQHVIQHGTVSGGVTTWDGSDLSTIAAGTSTFTHMAPDAASLHVYRVFAKNTDAGALSSTKVTSNTVQLLAPPNKPTLPALGPFVDKAKPFVPTWVHNPVDTTSQTAYEMGYSTDGGTTWSTTGKMTSAVSSKTFAASSYAADVALTIRVRTWGQATTGGSESTGASPWSDLATVTFKTRPVVTITAPVNGGTYTKSALTVALGFSQAEAATFVNATIKVYDSALTLIETLVSTTRASTLMGTAVDNGSSYTVKTTVIDANGLVSDEVTSTFDVVYTLPVPAVATATYLPDSGIGQLDITIAEPDVGQVAATLVTITRTIAGVVETVIAEYPKAASLTILDMTPTINGTNQYTVTTISADGATRDTLVSMITAEPHRAFLSSGSGFSTIISFKADLKFSAAPGRSAALVQAAGRSRPIALFGQSGTLVVSGSARLFADMGSTPQEVEKFILTSGLVCYRDPSGRRMFGALAGSLDSPISLFSEFQFSVAEAT
jgi:hypothetical protein